MHVRCASLVGGLASACIVGGAMLTAVAAAEMKPEEAKRFIAGKLFAYSCFDGTSGAGRIHADGSVIGTMKAGGRTRYFSLPVGTIKLSADSICASLPHALINPCFNVVQTSPHSFRGSLRGLGFAYCDFERRNPRLELAGSETRTSQPVESAVALRPSHE